MSVTFGGRKISAVDFANQSCVAYPTVHYADLGNITLEFEGYDYV